MMQFPFLSKRLVICTLLVILFGCFFTVTTKAQNLEDDFEGNGNIAAWTPDAILLNTRFANPFKSGINTSNTVLRYEDNGGVYSNVRFDVNPNFDLSEHLVFSIKIYVPSSSITGNQPNQVSMKLQDASLAEPWSTQTEIIKPIVLDQWQTITFDFENDVYINLNGGSPAPKARGDFNRLLIQLNGENNTDKLVAFIDDFFYEKPISTTSYKLVWADEFDGYGPIDTSKWFHQTALPPWGSWFNGEIQHYTNRTDNSIRINGVLNVIAKKETFSDQGFTKEYTSARLNSKVAFKYGKVEFRAKLPEGEGTWPAVWMLGKNIDENGAYWDNLGFGTTAWPACGEIDLLEHWGSNQNFVQSALHTPSSSGNTVNKGGKIVNTASSAFHVYRMEWTEDKISFSVDSIVYYTYSPQIKNANTWPFDAEQYFIINFAIQNNISPSFTQDALEIDYLRVYEKQTALGIHSFTNADVSIYPNPFTNELTLKVPSTQEKECQISLYSMDAKLLLSNTYTIENNTIQLNNLETLENGFYLIRFTLNGIPYQHKVLKF
jgi:beta-glucanase (GH16 family)